MNGCNMQLVRRNIYRENDDCRWDIADKKGHTDDDQREFTEVGSFRRITVAVRIGLSAIGKFLQRQAMARGQPVSLLLGKKFVLQ
jgi:hypothetical protein